MKTILCPIDFSPAARNALQYADQLALALPARLILFHNIAEHVASKVTSFGGDGYEPMRDPDHWQGLLARLESWKDQLPGRQGRSPVSYTCKIGYGPTPYNIADEALAERADLVVLGRKKGQGLKHMLSGSVVGDVVRQSPCPVLLIPPQAAFQRWSRIVFATTLGCEDAADIDVIGQLAARFQAKILFLHLMSAYSDMERQDTEKLFQHFRQKLPQVDMELHLQTQENIEEGIQAFTRHQQADLLVIGCHPRNSWESFILGDRARKMAFHTDVPLLVIHY
jgi:nucleotide-binding universal stress UspA family protein